MNENESDLRSRRPCRGPGIPHTAPKEAPCNRPLNMPYASQGSSHCVCPVEQVEEQLEVEGIKCALYNEELVMSLEVGVK